MHIFPKLRWDDLPINHFPHLVWHDSHFFFHLPVDRYWSFFFYGLTIVDGAEMNTGLWASLQTPDFVSFVYTHKWHLQVTQSSILTFWGHTLLFSIMLVPPYFYQVHGLLPSQSCPHCCLSAHSYSSGYGVLSHCAFTFLMSDGVEHLFTNPLPIIMFYYLEKNMFMLVAHFFKKAYSLLSNYFRY